MRKYSLELKAYYRFNGLKGKFEFDEFIDRQWVEPATYDLKEYIGTDILANDICPFTWQQGDYIDLNESQSTLPFQLRD